MLRFLLSAGEPKDAPKERGVRSGVMSVSSASIIVGIFRYSVK